MRLYKYVAPGRVDILANRLIRFTQVTDFNDPFEVVPYVAAFVPAEQEQAYFAQFETDAQSMLEEAVERDLGAVGQPLALKDLLLAYSGLTGSSVVDLMRTFLPNVINQMTPTFGREFQERFGERFGVLSLTEIPTSLLMWAHYGECHRGFVIEFESSSTFMAPPAARGAIGRLSKVVYAAERPAIIAYDPSLPVEEYGERLIRDVLLTKGLDWEYEQEWRMILPLDDPQNFRHAVSGRLHLFPLPSTAITAVILGTRAGDATARDVRAVLSGSDFTHVELRQARTSDTNYAVVIEPVPLS